MMREIFAVVFIAGYLSASGHCSEVRLPNVGVESLICDATSCYTSIEDYNVTYSLYMLNDDGSKNLNSELSVSRVVSPPSTIMCSLSHCHGFLRSEDDPGRFIYSVEESRFITDYPNQGTALEFSLIAGKGLPNKLALDPFTIATGIWPANMAWSLQPIRGVPASAIDRLNHLGSYVLLKNEFLLNGRSCLRVEWPGKEVIYIDRDDRCIRRRTLFGRMQNYETTIDMEYMDYRRGPGNYLFPYKISFCYLIGGVSRSGNVPIRTCLEIGSLCRATTDVPKKNREGLGYLIHDLDAHTSTQYHSASLELIDWHIGSIKSRVPRNISSWWICVWVPPLFASSLILYRYSRVRRLGSPLDE